MSCLLCFSGAKGRGRGHRRVGRTGHPASPLLSRSKSAFLLPLSLAWEIRVLVHQDYYYYSHPNLVYVHVPYQRHGNNVYGTPWGCCTMRALSEKLGRSVPLKRGISFATFSRAYCACSFYFSIVCIREYRSTVFSGQGTHSNSEYAQLTIIHYHSVLFCFLFFLNSFFFYPVKQR